MITQTSSRPTSTLQNHYLKQLSVLGHTMSSKSSLIMLLNVRLAPNCEAAGAIIEDKYLWSGCLVHTMNLLMHDIVKNKTEQYKWIGDLYKRQKNDKIYYKS